MPYISEEGRTTLREIERRHNLSTLAVAAIAHVEPSMVYRMEQGGALSRVEVERILQRLSQATGQCYTPETVGGYWINEACPEDTRR